MPGLLLTHFMAGLLPAAQVPAKEVCNHVLSITGLKLRCLPYDCAAPHSRRPAQVPASPVM